PAYDLALVMHEVAEQLILLRRELHRLATLGDLARARVEADVAGIELARRIARRAADQRAQAGDQLFGLEGLGEIIVGPRVEAGHLVRPAVARGKHQDGHLTPFLPPAVEDGQA